MSGFDRLNTPAIQASLENQRALHETASAVVELAQTQRELVAELRAMVREISLIRQRLDALEAARKDG